MARPRKNAPKPNTQELSLVPVEEQPYPLPEGWKWTYWGSCGDFIAGNAFKPNLQGQKGLLYPFYKVGSLKYSDYKGYLYDNENSISSDTQKAIKANIIPENSIIFAKIGEAIRLNRRSLNEKKCCIDNNLMAFIPQKIIYRYAYYWSLSIDLYKYTNATTVPAIRKTDLEKVVFPLPPLDEQERIVTRIESLFTKLDEAKEKAEAVLDSYETRKAAILHKAFTGELTAKWREERGIEKESWKTLPFEDCITHMQNGLSKRKGSVGNAYIVLRLTNLINNEIDIDDCNKIILDSNEILKYSLDKNDILMIRVNGSKTNVGKQFIFNQNENCAFCDHIIRLKYNNSILDTRFAFLFSQGDAYKHYIQNNLVSSAGQNTISRKGLANLKIPLPSIKEQQEITRILDSLLEKEQQSKEAAEAVLEQIDLMKKAILAKAFRGEL